MKPVIVNHQSSWATLLHLFFIVEFSVKQKNKLILKWNNKIYRRKNFI